VDSVDEVETASKHGGKIKERELAQYIAKAGLSRKDVPGLGKGNTCARATADVKRYKT